MIKSSSIKDLNHVKDILENIRVYNNYIDENYGKSSIDYELATENIVFQICELEEFIIGKENITKRALFNCDMRMLYYWDFIFEKIDFDTLINKLKEYST